MSVTHVVGDLIASDEMIIAHGCNTVGAFSAGFAGVVARAYPNVKRVYQRSVRDGYFMAGSAQFVSTFTNVDDLGNVRYVYNLGTQRDSGRCYHLGQAAYWPICLSVGNMVEHAVKHDIRQIAMPRIGCGIAGLQWSVIEDILEAVRKNVRNTPHFVVYTHPSEVGKAWN